MSIPIVVVLFFINKNCFIIPILLKRFCFYFNTFVHLYSVLIFFYFENFTFIYLISSKLKKNSYNLKILIALSIFKSCSYSHLQLLFSSIQIHYCWNLKKVILFNVTLKQTILDFIKTISNRKHMIIKIYCKFGGG